MTTEYTGRGDPRRSIELLWGAPERPRRGPKPKLTVAQITRAAIELADAEGLAAVSMRRIAEHLGVTGMSLYTYIPGKAELLDLMVDAVHGETAPTPAGDWRTRLEQVARENWALYLRHPWLLQVATSRPVLGPNVVAKYDRDLAAVADLGLGPVEMDLLVATVANYVHGAVHGAVEVAQAKQHTGLTDQEWWAAHGPVLEKVFDPTRYPLAASVGAAAGAEYQSASDPRRAFEFGLRLLLDGIAASLP